MAAAEWNWVETQALLQRLHQPTAASLAAEYDDIQKLNAFLASLFPTATNPTLRITLAQHQFAALLQRWCSLGKPLLLVMMDTEGMMKHPSAIFGAGMLLSMLGNLLECWAGLAGDEAAEAAVRQQIAQHTAGLLPTLGQVMSVMAMSLSKSSAHRRRRAAKPESAEEAAEAAHARDYFPQHSDIATSIHILSFWKGLASNWPGKLLRSSNSSKGKKSSSSSSSSSNRGGRGGSTPSLQETVLPACELTVALLKTWPPNIAGGSAASRSSRSSGSSSLPLPDAAVPRASVTSLAAIVSNLLLYAIRDELLLDESPLSTADTKFSDKLSASPAVQHLLLLQTAAACHFLHQERQGVSPIKAKAAAAAVTGSKELAAAAAAAETAAVRGASSSSGGGSKQQQQYLSVPAHHTAVLDLLLVPADTLGVRLLKDSSTSDNCEASMSTVSEFMLGIHRSGGGPGQMGSVQGLPQVAPELCAPLCCMLAEGAALGPACMFVLHMVLVFMQALTEVFFGVRLGFDAQVTPAAMYSTMVAYSSALTASLQLLGPAVLHAYKHSGADGDRELPPGGGGCPKGNDGQPLKGAPVRDAALSLFGSLVVKIASAPAIQSVLTAAFQQRPFLSAAVCEAAVRGAARHNQAPPGSIRMFASLAMNACWEVADTAPGSSTTRSDIVAAAVPDGSTREALLLQFGLITTQLKYTTGSSGTTSVFSGLYHHVMPTARTATRLGKLIAGSVGIDGDPGSSASSSSSSSSPEEQRVRVRAMLPWIHLSGRCLYFAGSQLLLVLDDSAAARAPGLNHTASNVMEQVLANIMMLLLTVGSQIAQLQQLQPEGTCILQGPPDAARKELDKLLEGKLAGVTQEWEGVLNRWKAASGVLGQMMASQGQSSSNIAWGYQLQQLLRTAVGRPAPTALQDAGAAVCAEFPLKLCCNNPGCTSMGKAGEMLLGSSCSGCKAARYCSKACQSAAWKLGHSKVCKRITKAAAAATAAASGVAK